MAKVLKVTAGRAHIRLEGDSAGGEIDLGKIEGIETGATADQTGAEIQVAILALTEAERVLISSEPTEGSKKVFKVYLNEDGDLVVISEE